MTLALSLAGLHASGAPGPWARGVRPGIAWASGIGFRAIHLDATAPEIRPRSLDRSARRDLAATIRREGLAFTGLDLWIPAGHFSPGEHADRAHAALLGAVDLAGDLAALVNAGAAQVAPAVSVTLPEAYTGVPEIAARCDALGVLVEDFGAAASDPDTARDDTQNGGSDQSHADGRTGGGAVRPGVDTGRLLLRDRPPGKSFAKRSTAVATLRLNDADDTGRRVMGTGRLEIGTLIALHATLTPGLPIVTDLRGLDDPERGARAAFTEIGSAGLPPLGG